MNFIQKFFCSHFGWWCSTDPDLVDLDPDNPGNDDFDEEIKFPDILDMLTKVAKEHRGGRTKRKGKTKRLRRRNRRTRRNKVKI